jgi:hypothetical protein
MTAPIRSLTAIERDLRRYHERRYIAYTMREMDLALRCDERLAALIDEAIDAHHAAGGWTGCQCGK